MKSTHEFFERGVANQKTPSIFVDIKMQDLSKMAKWDIQQKRDAIAFLETVKARIEEITLETKEYLRF